MWKRSIKIQKFSEFTRTSGNATLAMERQRDLVLDDQTVATFYCCPQHEKELMAGWALIHRSVMLTGDSITLDLSQVKSITPTKTAPIPVPQAVVLSIHDLYSLTASFQEAALLYKDTGTTHSVAVATPKRLLCNMEDIDPVVAYYKAVGHHTLNAVQGPIILMTSAKVDQTTVKIAETIGATTIISRSAPTDLGCDYATNKGISVIGYARGTRFSVYVDHGHLRR